MSTDERAFLHHRTPNALLTLAGMAILLLLPLSVVAQPPEFEPKPPRLAAGPEGDRGPSREPRMQNQPHFGEHMGPGPGFKRGGPEFRGDENGPPLPPPPPREMQGPGRNRGDMGRPPNGPRSFGRPDNQMQKRGGFEMAPPPPPPGRGGPRERMGRGDQQGRGEPCPYCGRSGRPEGNDDRMLQRGGDFAPRGSRQGPPRGPNGADQFRGPRGSQGHDGPPPRMQGRNPGPGGPGMDKRGPGNRDGMGSEGRPPRGPRGGDRQMPPPGMPGEGGPGPGPEPR